MGLWSKRSGGVRDPEEIRTQFRLPGADQVQRSSTTSKDLYSVSDTAAHIHHDAGRVRLFARDRACGLSGTEESAPVCYQAWVMNPQCHFFKNIGQRSRGSLEGRWRVDGDGSDIS